MENLVQLDVQKHIDILRGSALDRLTIYLSISIFFLLIGFFYHLSSEEWKDVYWLQSAYFVGAVGSVSLSKKLSYKTITQCYLGIGLLVAATEYINSGLHGAGDVASLFCLMLSLFYLQKKTTGLVILTILGLFGFSFFQNTEGADISHFLAWGEELLFIASFFLVIGGSLYHLQHKMAALLATVEQQKRIIEGENNCLEHLANYDALTGLSSLRLADKRLETVFEIAKLEKRQFALLFLDLDGFKAVNDQYGHMAGDEVLKVIANRISLVIRSNDTACRIGGDEFLIIVDQVDNKSDLESVCQRLINTINTPVNYHQTDLTVGVSIGAISYSCCAKNAKDLRLKADELMYWVKKNGKNNYKIQMESL
jgi:diguanylate cyclase (GGDEF)-like protein